MKSSGILPAMKGQKVIILGGLGFIGSNVAIRCLALGAKVTLYDCLHPRSGGNLYNIREIRHDVNLCYYDILDFDHLSNHIVGQEIIFNCAASTSHPFSMIEPWADLNINGRGVINLLEAVRRFNREAKLIHMGASTQLGKLKYRPADEYHPEFPMDIYSANKSASEKYVMIYSKAHGLRATVIRLSNVFGPRACINSPEFTFNNYFIGLALKGRDITVYGDGLQKRNVIYIDDVVSALILASQTEAVNQDVFFLVGDHHYRVSEIAAETVEKIGRGAVKHVEWPKDRKSIDVGDAILTNAKIKQILDWAPADDLSSGLIKTKDYFETCLAHYID